MQAMVSAANILGCFLRSGKRSSQYSKQQLEALKKNKLARWKQMAEVIRISFDISNNGFDTIRADLEQVMKFRGWAVHPPADQRSPVLHPDIARGSKWRFVAFSLQQRSYQL